MSFPILYVEDEEDYQMIVRRILTKAGFRVAIAETGEQGLAALRREKPGLLVLDINLPDTDGYSFCRTLRQDPAWRDLPVLIVTVRRRPEEWLKGFACGADDYVPKPLNPPELVHRVRSCLEGKSQRSGEPAGAEYLLTRAAADGNRAAFEVLIQQYRERLIDSLRSSGRRATEAEDLASSAFAKAYERLDQFRGNSSFYTWLYRIAVNEWHHARRVVAGVSLDELTHGDEAGLPPALAEPDPVGQDLANRVRQVQIKQAVSFVPRPYRQMLQWHFIRGLSCDSMARRLKIPAGTVMSRLFKAKGLFQQAWEENNK